MYVKDNKVMFSSVDMNFVKKFGIMEATEMVLDFKNTNPLPFIYDTYQLASLLCCNRKDLFSTVKNCDNMYLPIALKKKNGNIRQIFAPTSTLKRYQRLILADILEELPVSEYATAYRQGSRISHNALPHCNKKYLLKLDITSFFNSIDFEQVYSTVFNSKNFPKNIGVMLTRLCCRDGVLPQGAPTSPAISNLVMKFFDDTMGKWCKERGISYTRYCDDMTFSSDAPLYIAYTKAKAMLEAMGFELNEKKTHFSTNAGRQTVTGLVVNEKVSVSKEYKRKLRQDVYYAVRYGLEDAVRFAGKTDFLRDDRVLIESYYYHLAGRINFVLQIEPDNQYFKEALKRLEEKPEVLALPKNY